MRRAAASQAFTFAAIATQLHPGTPARAFVATTDLDALEECKAHGAVALKGGRIGGLNGLLLAAAAERGMPAIPFGTAFARRPGVRRVGAVRRVVVLTGETATGAES